MDFYVKEVYENRARGLGMAAFARARRRTEPPLFFQLKSIDNGLSLEQAINKAIDRCLTDGK